MWKKGLWTLRQKLELHCHEPRNGWSHHNLEEAGKSSPRYSLQKEHGPVNTLLDFWPLELWEYTFLLLFQAPKFVVICYTEALQNQYNIHC